MTSYPPGPKGNILLGSLNDMKREQLNFLLSCRDQYGDLVHFRVGPSKHLYMLNHPDYIHQVLVAEAEKYHKGPGLKKSSTGTINTGLLLSEDDFHAKQRRLAQPAFHTTRIAAYADNMVNDTLHMLDGWKAGQTRDIHAEMMKLTLNIVAEALFGTNVAAGADRIGEAITTSLETITRRASSSLRLPRWIPTAANREQQDAATVIDQTILDIIEARRASGEDTGDLLSMLLFSHGEGSDEPMSPQQVLAEAVTLFVAGHETTANALTWTWVLLAQHPEAEAKLLAEVRTALAGRAPTMRDLANLPYTDLVIKESMRLYPPAWLMTRQAIQDVTIGGYTIPKGSLLLISPYVMHHDPRYFENPEAFIPERFADGLDKRIPRYAYFPFGGGPRVCIGQSFAMMEARLLLATMAQRVHLSLRAGQNVEMYPLITLRPKNGVEMTVTVREAEIQPARA